jgi:quinol monooxygenase YgiN
MYEVSEARIVFVFVEEWESQDALDRHFATPHIAEFMAAVPGTLASAPEVRFHTVSQTVDLAEVRR